MNSIKSVSNQKGIFYKVTVSKGVQSLIKKSVKAISKKAGWLKKYIKGSGPNDGLMALMYAYMAYKFDLTKGFTIKPGFEKKQSMPMPVLANIKRSI